MDRDEFRGHGPRCLGEVTARRCIPAGGRTLARAVGFAAVTVLVSGCAGALIALEAVPAVVTGTSMATSDRRSPFVSYAPGVAHPDDPLGRLDATIAGAQCGDPRAQYELAVAMNNDFNARPDRVEIYKWYRLADLGGFAQASLPLTELEGTLSPTDLAEAHARVEAFLPAPAEACPPVL